MEGPTELVNNEDPIEFVRRKKTKKRKSRKNKRKSRKNKRKSRKIIKRKKTNRRGRKNKRRTNKRRLRGGCGCAGEGFAGGSVLIPAVGGDNNPAEAQAKAEAKAKAQAEAQAKAKAQAEEAAAAAAAAARYPQQQEVIAEKNAEIVDAVKGGSVLVDPTLGV